MSLARDWQEWLAENMLRGAADDALVTALIGRGLAPNAASAAVAGVRTSPLIAGARRLVQRAAGGEQGARLRRTLSEGPLEERQNLDVAVFHRDYWRQNRPVVVRGAACDWPAARWTLEGFAATLGDVEVEAMVGRSTVESWMLHREHLNQRMPLGQLVDVCLSTEGNDIYSVARNQLFKEPDLAPLEDDLGVLPGVVLGEPKMWLGPRGTLTPAHHDMSSAWFVQLLGRKELWIASNLEPALFSTARGVYNTADPSAEPATPELAEVQWKHTILHPGDAVFLPVGWWHQLLAHDPSVSVSFGRFLWPNSFAWYAPGR